MGRLNIRLATIPKFAKNEYHPDQMMFYSKFTEITFKALNLPSVIEFLERLTKSLNLEDVEVRICRMPAARSKVSLTEKEGKPHLLIETLRGRASKESGFIDIYPNLIWPSRTFKPLGFVGIRGFILNTSIKAVIHEILHKSGNKDESEVRKLTDRYYKEFRRIHLNRFDDEFKPILEEWKETEVHSSHDS